VGLESNNVKCYTKNLDNFEPISYQRL